jgi:hypothetical protein
MVDRQSPIHWCKAKGTAASCAAAVFLAGLTLLAAAPRADCGPKTPRGLVYRVRGSTLPERAQTALVIKTHEPLWSTVYVHEVDGNKFGGNARAEVTGGSGVTFLELAPGKHTLVVSADNRGQAVSGGFYSVSKAFPIEFDVQAGREYVLWAEVYEKGWKGDVTPFDEYCLTDYVGQMAEKSGGVGPSPAKWRSRCEAARRRIRKNLDEFWLARDRVAEAEVSR